MASQPQIQGLRPGISDETRAKLRAAATGKRHSAATRAKQSAAKLGKRPSDLAIQRAAEAKRGVPRPDVAQWSPGRFRRFDDETVARIRADRAKGMTYRALGAKYKCPRSTAHRVVHGAGVAYAL